MQWNVAPSRSIMIAGLFLTMGQSGAMAQQSCEAIKQRMYQAASGYGNLPLLYQLQDQYNSCIAGRNRPQLPPGAVSCGNGRYCAAGTVCVPPNSCMNAEAYQRQLEEDNARAAERERQRESERQAARERQAEADRQKAQQRLADLAEQSRIFAEKQKAIAVENASKATSAVVKFLGGFGNSVPPGKISVPGAMPNGFVGVVYGAKQEAVTYNASGVGQAFPDPFAQRFSAVSSIVPPQISLETPPPKGPVSLPPQTFAVPCTGFNAPGSNVSPCGN